MRKDRERFKEIELEKGRKIERKRELINICGKG